ncbi:hypothetical protein ACA348_00170 [Orientia tsutsugamushi]
MQLIEDGETIAKASRVFNKNPSLI